MVWHVVKHPSAPYLKFNKRKCINYLKPISKEQYLFLADNGYLKQEKGRYPDLSLTSKHKNAKRKHRYIPDYIFYRYFG